MKCPECQGELVKRNGLAENVWECTKCLARWFIIKTSQRKQ